MKIIAGKWRGRTLFSPKGEVTRPTAARVRESLFSMLVSRLGSFEGLDLLDLFAGSGALGLEALSRGAASVMFVEQDQAAITALNRNIALLSAENQAIVRNCSVFALGVAPKAYDLVLLDPPYEQKSGSVALDKLARLGWFADGALVSLETSRQETISLEGFSIDTIRDYGKARLHLLRYHQVHQVH